MPTASAIKYTAGLNKNWTDMDHDGDVLHDGAVNDTSTYANNSGFTGGGTGAGMTAIIDLGSDQNVDESKFTVYGDGDLSDTWQLQRASSASGGAVWTNVQGPIAIGTGPQSFDRTFTGVAARYWRLVPKATTSDNSTPWEVRIYDFRVLVGGAEYTFPAPSYPTDLFLDFLT